MRALVIEDDRKIAGFVARGLGAEDFAVEQCDTGERGLQLLGQEPFDVAILDLMLPGVDGLTVLKKLRAQRSNPPVIVLSAQSGPLIIAWNVLPPVRMTILRSHSLSGQKFFHGTHC
jgi:DNA-binding response OmpR family regulator